MPIPLLLPKNQPVSPALKCLLNNLVICREKIRYFVLHLVLFQFHKS